MRDVHLNLLKAMHLNVTKEYTQKNVSCFQYNYKQINQVVFFLFKVHMNALFVRKDFHKIQFLKHI